MGILGLGGNSGGYTSGDGLVNIPGAKPEDVLNGLRSVFDFRHIYGPDTPVPNINFGGTVVSGKLPNSALDANSGGAVNSALDAAAQSSPIAGKLPGWLQRGLRGAQQGMQMQQQGGLPQLPGQAPVQMPQMGDFSGVQFDPMQFLRGGAGVNMLGRLGQY